MVVVVTWQDRDISVDLIHAALDELHDLIGVIEGGKADVTLDGSNARDLVHRSGRVFPKGGLHRRRTTDVREVESNREGTNRPLETVFSLLLVCSILVVELLHDVLVLCECFWCVY